MRLPTAHESYSYAESSEYQPLHAGTYIQRFAGGERATAKGGEKNNHGRGAEYAKAHASEPRDSRRPSDICERRLRVVTNRRIVVAGRSVHSINEQIEFRSSAILIRPLKVAPTAFIDMLAHDRRRAPIVEPTKQQTSYPSDEGHNSRKHQSREPIRRADKPRCVCRRSIGMCAMISWVVAPSNAVRSVAALQTKCGRTGDARQRGDRLPHTASC